MPTNGQTDQQNFGEPYVLNLISISDKHAQPSWTNNHQICHFYSDLQSKQHWYIYLYVYV